MKQATISKGGQVSIPAAIRHRWRTSRVFIEDRGGELVLRPVPDDPIAAARGSLAGRPGASGMTSDDARARSREEEAEADGRRRGTVR